MDRRYKSLAAMDAEPWIAHFTKTAGMTSILSSRPKPVVIEKLSKGHSSGDRAASANEALPLTIVSPVGQSTEMAQADLGIDGGDKSLLMNHKSSLAAYSTGRAEQPRKRSQLSSKTQSARKRKLSLKRQEPIHTAKKHMSKKQLTKVRDIFS